MEVIQRAASQKNLSRKPVEDRKLVEENPSRIRNLSMLFRGVCSKNLSRKPVEDPKLVEENLSRIRNLSMLLRGALPTY